MTSVVAFEIDWRNFADELDNDVRTALVRSINRVADRSRTRAAAAVREQVNFPASYLSPSQGRLKVKERARGDSFEAVIRGQDRATSLARFVSPKGQMPQQAGGKRSRKQGVSITVSTGGARKTFQRGFLIKLKNGNVGLAVRTDGESPQGAYKPREIAENLYLLYGPSVDQALLAASDGGGVYEDMSQEMLDLFETEFQRQLELLRDRRTE